MRINTIIPHSFVDGPGQRTVLYAQGCTLACSGCQSRHTWPQDDGREVPVADLAGTLLLLSAQHNNITLSGGEITQQPQELAHLVHLLKQAGRHIVLYSGYTWEQLLSPAHPSYPWMQAILENVDILVDGPFIFQQDDDFVTWRGSRNQRPIDVQASFGMDTPVTLDWDDQITLTTDGQIIAPAGFANTFALGTVSSSRMCGQTKQVAL